MITKDLLIVPRPKQIIHNAGAFTLSYGAFIHIEEEDKEQLYSTSKQLKKAIYNYTSIRLNILTGNNNIYQME